jgi:F1F0 ATPase subunit 2
MTAAYTIAAGMMLAGIFYGGLWATITQLPSTTRPALVVMGSFWIRTLIVLGGFIFVTGQSWQRGVLCLGGFLLGRIVIYRWIERREGCT